MSDLPVTVDFAVYRGDSWTKAFRLLDGGAPHDLSDATVASWVRSDDGKTTIALAVTGASDGTIVLQPPASGVPAGTYSYDVEVDEQGTVLTYVCGRLYVREDVTNGD